MPQILDLPSELLFQIPQHLPGVEDHLKLSSTCRAFYQICQLTPPNTILRLCAAQSSKFFRPDPHFLVLACSRELSAWALRHEVHKSELREAFRSGVEGLLDLCVQKCGLRMQDVRKMYEVRSNIVNPISEAMKELEISYWTTGTGDSDHSIESVLETLQTERNRSVLQILIYSKLFGCDMNALLCPEEHRPILGHELRLDFLKYCIPERGFKDSRRLEILGDRTIFMGNWLADKRTLVHVLQCRRWTYRLDALGRETGPPFPREVLKGEKHPDFTHPYLCGGLWRQRLWASVLMMQGIEGFEVMWGGKGIETMGDGKWRERLKELRSRVEALQNVPRMYTYGPGRYDVTSDAPNMLAELYTATFSRWLGNMRWLRNT